jgi:hypothetical protein
MLDQNEDMATSDGFFVCQNNAASPPCSYEGGVGDPGRVVSGNARQAVQIVQVTGCSPDCTSGSTFTISPGVYAPNYAIGKSPGAWWPDKSAVISNAGLENLSVDGSGDQGIENIAFYNTFNSWVTGTRQVRTVVGKNDQFGISLSPGAHNTIANNYFYGSSGASKNYAIRAYISSDNLIANNIFQHNVVPMMAHGSVGNVYAYNYAINNTYDDGGLPQYHYMIGMIGAHSAGSQYNLFEGNIGQAITGDAVHGTPVMNTEFRNYLLGTDPGRTDNLIAVQFEAYARYWNIVGNVLGTPSVTNSYSTSSPAVFQLGAGRGTVPNDPILVNTLMRWGNYDVVSSAVRFEAAEDAHAAAGYPALSGASQSFPASFHYAAKPSWWPTAKAWPPIGPDVSGGNLANLGGHAYTIPAQDCYLNSMHGPTNGTGSVLTFNANTCYAQSGQSVVASPTNLLVVVR